MAQGAASGTSWARVLALALVGAAALTVVWLSGPDADPAHAAPCTQNGLFSQVNGVLTIQKPPPCGDFDETYVIFCSGGTVFIGYKHPEAVADVNTALPCNGVSQVHLLGNGGGDTLDLTGVAPALGFTSLNQQNLVEGGVGSDSVYVRNGVADFVDCGPDNDGVLADPQSVDGVTNCEIVSFLPPPVAATTAAPLTPAVTKKCKKRRRSAVAAKKKRCKKKALAGR